MKCPICVDIDLIMTERQNVEIDYCPTCRGVWLDRGELDKIIEKSVAQQPQPTPIGQAAADPNAGYAGRGHHGGYGHHGGGDGKHGRRRKSWLAEIFD